MLRICQTRAAWEHLRSYGRTLYLGSSLVLPGSTRTKSCAQIFVSEPGRGRGGVGGSGTQFVHGRNGMTIDPRIPIMPGRREGGCTQFVHGSSRMAIDPRIPTVSRRSTSGYHQPGGVLISRIAVVLRPYTLAFLKCWDGEGRVFANLAGAACTKREAP